MFAGFPPPKQAARRSWLSGLAGVPATLIFLESPHRLAESLADMDFALGAREAAVARELTKMHEEVRRGVLGGLAAHYAEAGDPKGEITIVVAPPGEAPAPSSPDIDAQLRAALAETSLREAVARVTAETGLPRREIYARALALTRPENEKD